jgi:hypothetical protein
LRRSPGKVGRGRGAGLLRILVVGAEWYRAVMETA